MTVTREAATVAEGTYVLSEDGLTLRVTANARIIVFERAPSERPPAGAPSSRAVRQAVRAGLVATMMFHGSCADVATRAGSTLPDRQRDADISAIEALNRHDVTAALASDIEAIVSQWSEDFVLLPQAGEFVRGRAANVAMIEGARHHLETFEPIAYDVYFEEIVVTGDYAFAWGRFRTAARPRAGGTDIVSNGKLLRIYQRQRDGRWLMHRTMSTMEPLGR